MEERNIKETKNRFKFNILSLFATSNLFGNVDSVKIRKPN